MDINRLVENNVHPYTIAKQFVDGLEIWDPVMCSEIIFDYFLNITLNEKIPFSSEIRNEIENLSINNLNCIFKKMPIINTCNLKLYHDIIIKICKLAYDKKILLTRNEHNNWLVMCKNLFQLMTTQLPCNYINTNLFAEDFHAVGSILSLPFAIIFSKIFTIQGSELDIIGQRYCQEFLRFAEKGIFSKYKGNYIADSICRIYENVTKLQVLVNNTDRIEFYFMNISNSSIKISNRFLQSIMRILNANYDPHTQINEYQEFKKFEKILIDNYDKLFGQFLYHTTRLNTYNLFIEILNYLYEKQNVECTNEQLTLLFFQIFEKNRIQHAKYYIYIMKKKYSEQENLDMKILKEMLNIYYKHKFNNKNLNTLVDQIFYNFDYIQNYENIFLLFPAGTDNNCTTLSYLAELIVCVTKSHLKSQLPGKDQQILQLIQKIPLLLEKSQLSLTACCYLLEIFNIIDINIYYKEKLTTSKYYKRLLDIFEKMISSTYLEKILYHDRLINNIFCILQKFNQLEFPLVTDIVKRIQTRCEMFIIKFGDFNNLRYDKYNDYTQNIMILSNILNNNFDTINNWQRIFNFIKTSLITGEIRKLGEHFNYDAESFSIRLVCDYLQKFYRINIYENGKNEVPILPNVMEVCRIDSINIYSYLIIEKEADIFFSKQVITGIITLVLILNTPNFLRPSDIQITYEHLIKKTYKFIFSHTDYIDDFVVDVKRDILNHLINFHKFVLPTHEIWRIVIEIGGDHPYNNELEKLVIQLIKLKDAEDFTEIYAYILYNIGVYKKYSDKDVIKAIQNITKKELPINTNNQTKPNYMLVDGAAVLYLIDIISNKILKRNDNVNISLNLAKPLEIIKPLLGCYEETNDKLMLKTDVEELKDKVFNKMTSAEKQIISTLIINLS